MCMLCIFIDKGIQSLRDDSAVVGGSKFHFYYFTTSYCMS